jgi:hypothetical protein
MGRPLVPNSDYHQWKALLKAAGVRDARLHDSRHTAAIVLLIFRCTGADGHGADGVVDHLNGFSLPSRHQSHSARRGCPSGQPLWATDQPGLKQLRPKLRPEPTKPTISRLDWEVFPLVAAAEDAGFEPARACTQPAFQASAIGL